MDRCKFCGAGYDYLKSGITYFKCGSSYGEGLSPLWIRFLKCHQDENELLKGQLERLQGDMKKLETYVAHVEEMLIKLNKDAKP